MATPSAALVPATLVFTNTERLACRRRLKNDPVSSLEF
jgi:hypothetical protein